MEIDSVKTEEFEQICFKQCPDSNHPHLIDLGMPSGTLWACCNVGATTPEDYGGYYAWGEKEEKYEYNWETYQYGSVEENCQFLGSDIAGTQYDVAHEKWGSSWVMPSEKQINELRFKCDYEWTTFRGVNGCKFTGPNGGCIFLPAAGWHKKDKDLVAKDTTCLYWSSTHGPIQNLEQLIHMDDCAATLRINPGDTTSCLVFFSSGLSVRPVAIIKAHTEAKEAVAEEAYKK